MFSTIDRHGNDVVCSTVSVMCCVKFKEFNYCIYFCGMSRDTHTCVRVCSVVAAFISFVNSLHADPNS